MKLAAGGALLVLILALTNPSQDDFVGWVKAKAYEKTDNPGARFLADLFASPLVAATTQRSNLVICSLYSPYPDETGSRNVLATDLNPW